MNNNPNMEGTICNSKMQEQTNTRIYDRNIPYIIPSFSHSWMITADTQPVFISNMYDKISCYLFACVCILMVSKIGRN